jgi:hypothetical protein
VDQFYNLPCHKHFLLLGKSNIGLFVGSNKLSKVHVSKMAVAGSAPTAQHIIFVRLFNVSRGM